MRMFPRTYTGRYIYIFTPWKRYTLPTMSLSTGETHQFGKCSYCAILHCYCTTVLVAGEHFSWVIRMFYRMYMYLYYLGEECIACCVTVAARNPFIRRMLLWRNSPCYYIIGLVVRSRFVEWCACFVDIYCYSFGRRMHSFHGTTNLCIGHNFCILCFPFLMTFSGI